MNEFIQRLMKAARKLTVTDFACLKICLLSLGILLGAYFAQFFLSHTFFLWVIFIASYIWIMYRTFVKHME